MKVIRPDIDFIKIIKRESGSDIKSCMQCGNCTVVCSLAGENNIFPRKQMIMTAWGMKEELIADPYIWQCHQCGDCSQHCPRDVRPQDVMSSLRSQCIEYYAIPSFFVKWMKNPFYYPLTLLIPAVILILVLWTTGSFDNMPLPVNYSAFFPHLLLNSFFSVLTIFFFVLMLISVKKYNHHFIQNLNNNSIEKNWFSLFWETIIEFLKHKNFSSCQKNKYLKATHLLIFYGFSMLILVTLYAIYAVKTGHYPLNHSHPAKILGNLSGISILTGIIIILAKRINKKNNINTQFYDVSFLISILLLVLSGFITEFMRFSNSLTAYYWYIFHLVIMWHVVIFLPYTKFAHFIYRINAIILLKKYNVTD